MILFLLSFAGGALTVLAPCVLPLLPVIVGGSIGNVDAGSSRRKMLTVITSLGLSVIAFTLLLKVSTLFINIPQSLWTWVSGSIILILGIVTVFPSLYENTLLARLSMSSNKVMGTGLKKNSFWGDVIIGASLGPVFSTCSPTYFIVLATVLPVSPLLGLVYLTAYTVGLCLMLFVVALVGQKIMDKLGAASDPKGTFKRILGVLFILVGIAILTGFDKIVEAKILSSGVFDVTRVEQKLLQKNLSQPAPVTVTGNTLVESNTSTSTPGTTPENKDAFAVGTLRPLTPAQQVIENQYPRAHELVTPDGYINTDGKPITIAQFKGKKVVLLDIWTYSCINCQRTLPYIKQWYESYKDQGLEVISIHTPEFAFEKNQKNVEDAVKRFGIEYPVILDNEYQTWNAYGNQYWPRKYLIDIEGRIVYDHIGEGNYEETEAAIMKALKDRATRLGTDITVSQAATPSQVITVDQQKIGSPETYFGSARNLYLANGKQGVPGTQTLTIPSQKDQNKLYLGGTWNFSPEYAETTGQATIDFNYNAKNVYIVAAAKEPVSLDVYKDGVFVKTITISDNKLYTLIEGLDYGAHSLELRLSKGTLDAFTFTFG